MSPEEMEFRSDIDELLFKLDELIKAVQDDGVEVLSLSEFIDPDDDFDTITYIDDDDLINKTAEFLLALKKITFPGGVIQYSLISQRVFSDKNSFDAIEYIVEQIKNTISENFNEELEKDKELARRCYKLLDHLLLASFQIGEILQHTKVDAEVLKLELFVTHDELKKTKDELEETKNKIQEEQEKLSNKIFEFQNEFTKIYIQFVTILGIFTAIVVSIFGGLQIINESFVNLHLVPIWKTTLIISLFSIAILCMLTALTGWISTIINRVFDKKYKPNFKEFILHNGAFATGIFIFAYVAIASAILSSLQTKQQLSSILNAGNSWPIIILLAFPLIVGIGVLIKTVDYRKYK